MLLNGNIAKPIAGGLLLLGTIFHPSVSAQNAVTEPDYSYVVTIQDYYGKSLCNGAYVGGNQVLLYDNCRVDLIPFPLPLGSEANPVEVNGEPVQVNQTLVEGMQVSADLMGSNASASASMMIDPGAPDFDYSDDEYSFYLAAPGYPYKVVFTDREGVSQEPVQIKRWVGNPYNGSRAMVAVNTVPDNVSSITVASLDQIEQMETQEQYPLILVSRDLDGQITEEKRRLEPFENCSTFPIPIVVSEQDALNRNVCIKGAPVSCGITLPGDPNAPVDETLGASFIAQLENGDSVLVAQRTPSCDIHPAASNHKRWVGTSHFKSLGLQMAVAYDLGERDAIERPLVNVKLYNESAEQKFDVSDIEFLREDGFNVIGSNCSTLEPGDGCVIKVSANTSDAVTVKNQLMLNINGEDAGIYTNVDGIAHRLLKGDPGSLWKMKGWKTSSFGLFGQSIYTNAQITKNPLIERTRNVLNPSSITVNYKMEGDSQLGASLAVTREQMGATHQVFNLLGGDTYTLPGTNGEWVTKTFDINQPGAYSVSIGRFIYITSEEDEFDMAIKSICFDNECE